MIIHTVRWKRNWTSPLLLPLLQSPFTNDQGVSLVLRTAIVTARMAIDLLLALTSVNSSRLVREKPHNFTNTDGKLASVPTLKLSPEPSKSEKENIKSGSSTPFITQRSSHINGNGLAVKYAYGFVLWSTLLIYWQSYSIHWIFTKSNRKRTDHSSSREFPFSCGFSLGK